MEPRFAYDFSHVRVHTDERAAQSAHDVDALAYTQGSDIVFAQGQYAPETQEGKGLLVHELTHVVQQRDVNTQSSPVPGPENDSYEQQAERMSAAAMTNISPTMAENFSGPGPGSVIQRKRPTMEQRLEALEKREQADEDRMVNLEKHQQAQDIHLKSVDIDQAWQAKFEKRFSSYREAIDRISNGLQTASKGFNTAQQEQAETEAMVMEVIGGMVTLAGGFEWAFAAGLGKLGVKSTETAEHIVALAHAGTEVAFDASKEIAKKAGAEVAKKPELLEILGFLAPAGAAGGDPFAFLTTNSAALEKHLQNIRNAFIAHSNLTQNFSDDDWLCIDVGAQERLYSRLFDDLNTVASEADKLTDDNELARILERHIWANWMSKQVEDMDKEMQEEQKDFAMYNPLMNLAAEEAQAADKKLQEEIYGHEIAKPEQMSAAEQMFTPGGDIEKRLIEVGVDKQAGVELSGHWYSSNSPDNWRELLIRWAHEYKEGIGK
jgi:hypothetical protein